MKKFTKVLLILFAICMALGIGFVSAGIALGATVQSVGEVWRTSDIGKVVRDHHIWHDIEDIEDSVEEYTEDMEDSIEQYAEDMEETALDMEDYGDVHHRFEDVEELKVELFYGNLYLDETEAEDIQMQVFGDTNGNIQVNKEGKELKIKGKKIRSLKDAEIHIYIPKGMSFRKMELNTGAGIVNAYDLHARELEVEIGAGIFEGTGNVTAEESKWAVGTGEILLSSLDSDKTDISCGMGVVNANLLGSKEDYSYEVEVGVGSITLGDEDYSGLGGSREMEIECGMGSVAIEFINE